MKRPTETPKSAQSVDERAAPVERAPDDLQFSVTVGPVHGDGTITLSLKFTSPGVARAFVDRLRGQPAVVATVACWLLAPVPLADGVAPSRDDQDDIRCAALGGQVAHLIRGPRVWHRARAQAGHEVADVLASFDRPDVRDVNASALWREDRGCRPGARQCQG